MPRKSSKLEPQILDLPPQIMAVVKAKGAPGKVFPEIMPALYGSVYSLKFDRKKKGLRDFKVTGLRARYPDAISKPKDQWTIIAGLPVPNDVDSLPQKVEGIQVNLEAWNYGTVAQILYFGAYDQETISIKKLHDYINEKGYIIAGDHEEEYLTRPNVKMPKTIIRYVINKA